MTITLNDKAYEIQDGITLASFIDSLGLKREGIAVAIRYEVVPKERWADTLLSEGMELMLIHAVSGGEC
jgi:thiamine biosynthesis protein ThiS